jgi:hypothetical protein
VSAQSPKAALLVARDGLDAVHREMVFARDGVELPLGDALRTLPATCELATEEVRGQGVHPGRLEVPYAGELLVGDALRRRLDDWVRRGVVEPSFADAVGRVVEHPEWLDAADLTVALVGAAAEMGPLASLAAWGATVAAVDIRSPRVWDRVLAAGRAGTGRLLVPVDASGVRGADLMVDLPEVAAWLRAAGNGLVVGNYAYADGADFVRVAAAADALVADLVRTQDAAAIAYLATPTDVFAVPMPIVEAARRDGLGGRRGRFVGGPLRTITGGRAFAPNYERLVTAEDGRSWGLADSLVAQQGPNYALAKRLQRWRAVVAREHVVTSANVAPATRTRSVVKNRVLAAAYRGAGAFGVEVFEPATSSALMAALLVHDLRNPRAAAQPTTELDSPLDLFVDGAAHGGLWRLPYAPRSVLPLAAVEGLLRPGR